MVAPWLFASLILLPPLLAGPARAQDLPATMVPPPQKPEAGTHGDAPSPAGASALPADEAACRQALAALGVAFAEADPIDDAAQGCAAPHPVSVSRLSPGVELRPPALLTCAMAEASARYVRDHVAPLARRELGSPPAAVEQASAYVCRPRHGTRKLSEHAFANALDWSAVTLEDGTRIEIRAYDADKEPRRARFLAALRAAACGPFATVLGPGSDADHADHFHFDMAERRAPFCQRSLPHFRRRSKGAG